MSIPGVSQQAMHNGSERWVLTGWQEAAGGAVVMSSGNGASATAAAAGAGEPAAPSMRAKRKRRSILEAQGTVTA